MGRDEYMERAKASALEYLDDGDWKNGLASMLSDLTNHEELRDHPGIKLGMMLMMAGKLNDVASARAFIVGFR